MAMNTTYKSICEGSGGFVVVETWWLLGVKKDGWLWS